MRNGGTLRLRCCTRWRRAAFILSASAWLIGVLVAAPSARAQSGDGLIVFAAGLDLLGGTIGALFGTEERGGIYAMRPDGSGLRQLTSFQTFNFRYQPDVFALPDDHPTLSPDGRQVLFASSRIDEGGILAGIVDPDNYEVFVMKVNGTEIRRLTYFDGFDGEAVFSPDGTRIAFASQCAGQPQFPCTNRPNIYVMDTDGNVLQRVTASSFNDIEPAWTPDGQRIVYTRLTDEGTVIFGDEQKHIRIADADGLNKNDHLLYDAPGQDHDASVHPNGGSIVITSEGDGTFPYGDVVRVSTTTGQLIANLTIDDTFLGIGGGGDPIWSPDGTKIAYIKAQLGILRGPQKIHIMNANGSGKVRLDRGIPGLLNIHQNWGVLADGDGDGTPDYRENGNTSFNREAVTGFTLFGQVAASRSQPGEHFGAAIALADLTHDGRLDLIVGSPGLDDAGLIPDSGGIAIVPGTEYGPQFSPTLFESLATVLDRLAAARPLPVANGRFGQTLASGDFNGDSFTDVAIGAPGQNRVLVLYGGLSSQLLSGTGEFGAALAAGDFNADGRADLAVGAPADQRLSAGQSVAAGSVRVFYGSPSGLSPTPQTFDQGDLPLAAGIGREEADDRFGAALLAGDVDGDNIPDLVVGVPREDIDGIADAGLFHVVPARAGLQLQTALAVHRDARALPAPHAGLQANARFGSVFAAGRFRGGSLAVRNLIVGVPEQDVTISTFGTTRRVTRADAGLVAVFEGKNPILAATDPLGNSVEAWTAATVGDVLVASGRFGQTLAVGKVSGDGVRDLVIAAPGQTIDGKSQAGAVYVVLGSDTSDSLLCCIACGNCGGLVPATAQRLDQRSAGTVPEAGDRFGAGLVFPSANTLAVGDMDGDGQDDLFIGTPEEDGSGVETGLVSIRYGTTVGIGELEPAEAAVRAGDEIAFDLTWTHPELWRDLEIIHFRLVDDERSLFWVRFDARDNVFSVIEEDQPIDSQQGVAGTSVIVGSADVVLDLERSEVVTSGPTGASLTLRLPLRFRRGTPAGTFRVELLVTDVHGNSQGFEQAGTLTVQSPPPGPGDDDGCSLAAPHRRSRGAAWLLLALLPLVAWRRRQS